MELIYTDHNFSDIGVLKEATCDFAFGNEENNFEIVTTKRNAKLPLGGYCYYENTEYGGIIDKMTAANNDEEVKYGGRTWHGMLNSFIMDFESEYLINEGAQYTLIENVQAKDVVAELVAKTNLSITVDNTYDKILDSVSVDARLGLYDFIVALLKPSKLKIYFRYIDTGITLYIGGASEYDEESNFDTSQMQITATKNTKFTNHFVLHNYQESENKHRELHLYTDEVGNIQPYSSVDNPLRDEDYIQTDDNKVLTGDDEVVQLLEDTSSKENYRLEDASIANLNWRRDYNKYYELVPKEDSEEEEYEYKQLQPTDDFIKLDSAPADWSFAWNRYYKKTGDNSYTQLSDDDNANNVNIKWIACYRNSFPAFTENIMYMSAADWSKKWNDGVYFTRTWDGNEWVYDAVEGVDRHWYKHLGSAPTDWKENKSNYYVWDTLIVWKVKIYQVLKGKDIYRQTIEFNSHTWKQKKYKAENGKYIKTLVEKKGLNKKARVNNTKYKMVAKDVYSGYVTIETYQKRRGKDTSQFKFNTTKVYRQMTYDQKAPPTWEEPNNSHSDPKGYFMQTKTSRGNPTWQYITQTLGYEVYAQYDKIPAYSQNKYYLKVQDHFASLIEKAKEKLAEELDKTEEARAELDIETYEFDVGDYVGGINPITKEPFKSIVTKKIAKINSTSASISYEIG